MVTFVCCVWTLFHLKTAGWLHVLAKAVEFLGQGALPVSSLTASRISFVHGIFSRLGLSAPALACVLPGHWTHSQWSSVCSMRNFHSSKSHGPPWQGYHSHAVKCPLHCVVQGSDLVERNTILFVLLDSPSFSPKIISFLDHFPDPVPCKPSQVGMSSRVGRWQASLNCLAFVLHRKKSASLGIENWGYQSRNRVSCECSSTDRAGIVLG